MVRIKRYVVLAILVLAIVGLTQLEVVRRQERSLAEHFIAVGEMENARRIYQVLSWQNDPVSRNNFHALDYYLAINAGDDIRYKKSVEAANAWRETGVAGVGASFWNLAMLDIKYGRAEKAYDKNTTYWLQEAANEGVHEAVLLLRAGEGEYDRLKVMMELGDPGAALTWASVMSFAGNAAESERALRVAADAGSFLAMGDLGWSLIKRPDAEQSEAIRLLETAARMGDKAAAERLGNCYNYAFYPCAERDVAEAVRWYELGLGPAVRYSLPRITIDADGAIRLGAMAKWNALHGGGGANYELAKLLINGDGVPQDRERALALLEQAKGYWHAEALLERLRQETDLSR